MDKCTDPNIINKSLRSIIVRNIPHDCSEEKIKTILSEVGPVASFHFALNKENSSHMGYGYCEYTNLETAHSALRNLNNYTLEKGVLKLESAANEKSRLEMQQIFQALPAAEPEKAPEAISKAVACLPPEQMYELMKQIKACIHNNPQDARNMLVKNPQLTYALLQAQLVMKIVDPKDVMKSLTVKPTIVPPPKDMPVPAFVPIVPAPVPEMVPLPVPPPVANPSGSVFIPQKDVDLRSIIEPRQPEQRSMDPRVNRTNDSDMRNFNMFSNQLENSAPLGLNVPVDPRQRKLDPRLDSARSLDPRLSKGLNVPMPVGPPSSTRPVPAPMPVPVPSQEKDKTALIMQVLQLSDEQIALLPLEQRNSILILKEQIARNVQV